MTTQKPKLPINKLKIASKLYEKDLLESCKNILSKEEIAEGVNWVESFILWCRYEQR